MYLCEGRGAVGVSNTLYPTGVNIFDDGLGVGSKKQKTSSTSSSPAGDQMLIFFVLLLVVLWLILKAHVDSSQQGLKTSAQSAKLTHAGTTSIVWT